MSAATMDKTLIGEAFDVKQDGTKTLIRLCNSRRFKIALEQLNSAFNSIPSGLVVVSRLHQGDRNQAGNSGQASVFVRDAFIQKIIKYVKTGHGRTSVLNAQSNAGGAA